MQMNPLIYFLQAHYSWQNILLVLTGYAAFGFFACSFFPGAPLNNRVARSLVWGAIWPFWLMRGLVKMLWRVVSGIYHFGKACWIEFKDILRK